MNLSKMFSTLLLLGFAGAPLVSQANANMDKCIRRIDDHCNLKYWQQKSLEQNGRMCKNFKDKGVDQEIVLFKSGKLAVVDYNARCATDTYSEFDELSEIRVSQQTQPKVVVMYSKDSGRAYFLTAGGRVFVLKNSRGKPYSSVKDVKILQDEIQLVFDNNQSHNLTSEDLNDRKRRQEIRFVSNFWEAAWTIILGWY